MTKEKLNHVKLASLVLIKVFQQTSDTPYKSLIDFLIIEIRDGEDDDWNLFMKDIFQHIVDNYDNKSIDNML